MSRFNSIRRAIASVCLISSAGFLSAESASADSCDSLTSDCGCTCGVEPWWGSASSFAAQEQFLLPQNGLLKFRGWLNGGYVGNVDSPASKFNGPYNAVDRSNEPMFNQGYLIAETALPSNGGSWIGARADFLYGEDFLLAQSLGLERNDDGSRRWNSREYYGAAMPQAFAEVGSKTFNVKLGHFYSIVGYEGVMAPDNFFYTKSYSYQFAGPFTHTGGLATWQANSNWQFQTGLTNGWDSVDRVSDRMGVLAGVRYTGENVWSSFAITTGDDTNNLAGLPGVTTQLSNRTRYSLLAGLKLTDKTQYVFHHWYGRQTDALANGSNADWYGIDQYIYSRLTSTLRHGVRVEWFHDSDGTRLGLNRPSNLNNPPFVGDVYSLSYGFNYVPVSNFMVRPEIRSDWFEDQAASPLPFDDGNRSQQLLLSIDATLRF